MLLWWRLTMEEVGVGGMLRVRPWRLFEELCASSPKALGKRHSAVFAIIWSACCWLRPSRPPSFLFIKCQY